MPKPRMHQVSELQVCSNCELNYLCSYRLHIHFKIALTECVSMINRSLYTCLSTVFLTALVACDSGTVNSTAQINQLKLLDNSSSVNTQSFTAKRYVGNLNYVLGDVKQGLITDQLNSTNKIDNLLKGFKEMGVNGIRIPIYPVNNNPNPQMFDYLYSRAKSQGFKIFANPAQGSGGQRIASGALTGSLIVPIRVPGSEQTLIDVVRNFAADYESDWINPFNEDGRPDSVWSTTQINDIYEALSNNINGADLVGPGVWGIPASIEVLNETNIKRYIKVATTHNLGFNHSYWDEFFSAAGTLPVWDSEATNTLKDGTSVTRLDAALNAGVDGIVLYNSWNRINLDTGALKSGGQQLKDKVTQYYHINNLAFGKNIKPFSDTADTSAMVQVPGHWNGDFSSWELIPTDNGYFQFKNRGSKLYFRPRNSSDFSDIISTDSFSGNGHHTQWRIEDANDDHLFVVNRATGKKLRSKNSNDISTSNDVNTIKLNQAPISWTGDNTQWRLIPAID